jgi:hypothetical protein
MTDTSTENPVIAPQYKLITTSQDYVEAAERLINFAQRTLRIFDPDGQQLGLNTHRTCEMLHKFVASDREQRVRIVVHSIEHLSRGAPRFLALLQTFPERIIVNRSEGEALRAEDCFVIADEADCVRRAVAKQRRGALIEHDPAEVSRQIERFEEIWIYSVPGLSATTLGL